MTLEIIQERLIAVPFVPITIHLSDGRFFHIDHPDFAALLRVDRTLIVYFAPGRVAYLNVGNITTVETTDAEGSA